MKTELLKAIGELQILALRANESEDHNISYVFYGGSGMLSLKVEDDNTGETTFSEFLFIKETVDVFALLKNWKKVLQAIIIPDIEFELEILKTKQQCQS